MLQAIASWPCCELLSVRWTSSVAITTPSASSPFALLLLLLLFLLLFFVFFFFSFFFLLLFLLLFFPFPLPTGPPPGFYLVASSCGLSSIVCIMLGSRLPPAGCILQCPEPKSSSREILGPSTFFFFVFLLASWREKNCYGCWAPLNQKRSTNPTDQFPVSFFFRRSGQTDRGGGWLLLPPQPRPSRMQYSTCCGKASFGSRPLFSLFLLFFFSSSAPCPGRVLAPKTIALASTTGVSLKGLWKAAKKKKKKRGGWSGAGCGECPRFSSHAPRRANRLKEPGNKKRTLRVCVFFSPSHRTGSGILPLLLLLLLLRLPLLQVYQRCTQRQHALPRHRLITAAAGEKPETAGEKRRGRNKKDSEIMKQQRQQVEGQPGDDDSPKSPLWHARTTSVDRPKWPKHAHQPRTQAADLFFNISGDKGFFFFIRLPSTEVRTQLHTNRLEAELNARLGFTRESVLIAKRKWELDNGVWKSTCSVNNKNNNNNNSSSSSNESNGNGIGVKKTREDGDEEGRPRS